LKALEALRDELDQSKKFMYRDMAEYITGSSDGISPFVEDEDSDAGVGLEMEIEEASDEAQNEDEDAAAVAVTVTGGEEAG
jgi:hypothetical protein